MHYLTLIRFAFVLVNRNEMRISAWLYIKCETAIKTLKENSVIYTVYLSNPKTHSTLKWICSASLQLLSHLGSQMKTWKRDSNKIDIRNRNTNHRNVYFPCIRRAARLLIFIINSNQTVQGKVMYYPFQTRHLKRWLTQVRGVPSAVLKMTVLTESFAITPKIWCIKQH